MHHQVNIFKFLLLLALAGLSTCISPLDIEVGARTGQLVVDGLITDQPGPYQVRLSRPAAYNQKGENINIGVIGATVTIKDDKGVTIPLAEQPNGVYSTISSPDFRGQVGRTYTLNIVTVDKKRYASQPELLKAVSPIDSIYSEYKDGSDGKAEGFYVYIDSKDPATKDDYYRYKYTGYSRLIYCEEGRICCSDCWSVSRCFTCININSDALVNGQAIRKQQIFIIPYTSRGRYFIEVEQSSLSKAAFQFWKQAKQQSQNVGGTFDAPPAPVTGNIFNVNDPEETVFGFFGASGISQKYRSIRRDYVKTPPYVISSPPPPTNMGPPPPCMPCIDSPFRMSNKPTGWEE